MTEMDEEQPLNMQTILKSILASFFGLGRGFKKSIAAIDSCFKVFDLVW